MASARDVFFNEVYRRVREGEDAVIVTPDLGAPSLDDFRRDFGNRFISVGIAEQNLVAVASGLAMAGKKVIAYGLNPFPVTRAFDQIRNLMAYKKIPITLAALNAGLCSAEAGFSHVAIEDVALMRTLANVKVVNPSDGTLAKAAARLSMEGSRPLFIRFDKQVQYDLYETSEVDFDKGFMEYGSGRDVAVVTSGYLAERLRGTAKRLEGDGIATTVLDCYCLPVDESALLQRCRDSRMVVTVEENALPGGLGSMVLEVMADAGVGKPVKRFGVNVGGDYFRRLGNREYIAGRYHLDADHLYEDVKQFYMANK